MTPLLLRIAAVLLLVAALIAGYAWWAESLREDGREEIRAEHAEAARESEARMRDLQRAAEKRYVVQAEARDRLIVHTVKEVRHATQDMAGCVLSPDAVRLLNDAASCARGDPGASCGAGEQVPSAGDAR